MGKLPTRSIIVCNDGYCRIDHKSKICCAVCNEKGKCGERCEPVDDNSLLQLCKHQQSVRMDELDSFRPKGKEGLRYNVICYACEEPLSEGEEDSFKYDGEQYCEMCFYESFDTCGYCGEILHQEGMRYVEYKGYSICESCFDDYFYSCVECEDLFHMDNTGTNVDDERVCDWCWERLYTTCDNCEEGWKTEATRVTDIEETILCPNCWLAMVATCQVCGQTGYRENMLEHGDYTSLCNVCHEDLEGTEQNEENSEGGN